MKNVVLLTIDILRKDVLGCYDNEIVLTPFIDALADKCIRFTRAYSTGPYTQSSFPGILTSSYYLDFGRQKMLSKKRVLISEVLKKEGIATAGFHSNPINPIEIELVEPLFPNGATAKALKDREEGLTLLSLKVTNLDEAMAEMKSRKIRLIEHSKHGKSRIVIYHPKDLHGVMIELIEYETEHPVIIEQKQ